MNAQEGWVLAGLLAVFGGLWWIADSTHALFFAVGAHLGQVVTNWQHRQMKRSDSSSKEQAND